MTIHPPSPMPPDEPVHRAAAALRHLPDVPAGAVDRVVAAAVARNGVAGRRSLAGSWLARAAVLALAAGLGAVTATYGVGRGRPETAAAPVVADAPAAATASSSIALRAALEAEERPLATPFVLARRDARRVAVVGDFNGWNPTANVMTADARGVWSTTVPLTPGRHAYAFVVDDSVWVTDPRTPVVRDADYGRDQSVLLVGHPCASPSAPPSSSCSPPAPPAPREPARRRGSSPPRR